MEALFEDPEAKGKVLEIRHRVVERLLEEKEVEGGEWVLEDIYRDVDGAIGALRAVVQAEGRELADDLALQAAYVASLEAAVVARGESVY